ncbi:MAG: DUF1080 domain-containing protein [Bryobacteraceae bacterium]|nr:DUF1080 domain-containing protein [Bryobacteraceae bacterium]
MVLISVITRLRRERSGLVFDGKSLQGWQARATSAPPVTGDWQIADGAILCGGGGAGWLATDESFQDFRLQLEFRGAATVNSGVFLRSEKQGEPHVTGYELQIWDMQPAGFLTGSLVGSVKASPTKIKPDAWNRFDVTARGDHFVVKLNGAVVLDAHDQKHAAGVIGLQCQPKQRIAFRNLRVRKLELPGRHQHSERACGDGAPALLFAGGWRHNDIGRR